MVGSKDYFNDTEGAFNVTTALRQPGSSIKPIMYSLAIENKILTSATVLDDSPVTYVLPGSAPYKPVNYDGTFHGRIPMRYALANSYNIPAVKTMNILGVEPFINHARLMGISTWNNSSDYGLSLSLGGGEVTMIDMATAYGVFANKGKRVNPEAFIKIQNHTGKIIYSENRSNSVRVISEDTAFIITDILSDSFARQFAFGRNSLLEIPGKKVAVKTGTTDLKKDNWTIGYNDSFIVVSWVGNNDGTPMNQYLSSGITGAAPIWNRIMTHLINEYQKVKSKNQEDNIIYANEKMENDIFSPPSSIVKKKCYYGRDEYFISGTEKGMCGMILNPSPSSTP
jgi:membrane peptidoglycan carboxypeptidase